MITSLYEINTSLQALGKQLQAKQPQPTQKQLHQSIQQLLSEVKYLDEKERAPYIYLISEIYLTKMHDCQASLQQLKQFDESLQTQVYMNCELRFAIIEYYKGQYNKAEKHLDTALGFVEDQVKLVTSAKFFFGRVLNRSFLENQTQTHKNFQATFILSVIDQYQEKQTEAIKQIENMLEFAKEKFLQYQIYKQILSLYEIMRKKELPTIFLSKKALETYRQALQKLQEQNTKYLQNYKTKKSFLIRILKFMTENQNNSQKLKKKIIDMKLLAYLKLKKCSKNAPNKNIKVTLQNTAKLIRHSKDTQLLDSTLNFDFVSHQYKKYKILYKYATKEEILKLQAFNNICNCQVKNIPKEVPRFKSIGPKRKVDFADVSQKEKDVETPNNFFHFTDSQQFDEKFQGSNMVKIHASSEGSEERYFYFKPQSVQQKPRLYYCASKQTKSDNDNYYSLKGLKKVTLGKKTQALNRKDAKKYESAQCFSLLFGQEKDRNFYVPDAEDYEKWIKFFQFKLMAKVPNLSKMLNTVAFSKMGTKSKLIEPMGNSQMKKSRKVIQI